MGENIAPGIGIVEDTYVSWTPVAARTRANTNVLDELACPVRCLDAELGDVELNFSTIKIQAFVERRRCKNSNVLHLWGRDRRLQYPWHIDDLPIKQSLNRHFKDHPWVFPQQGERDQCCRTNVPCVNPGAKVLRGTRRLAVVQAHDGLVWKVATCLAVRQLH